MNPLNRRGSEVSASLNGDVPAIQFENVSFGYEEDKPVLKTLIYQLKRVRLWDSPEPADAARAQFLD